MDATIIGVDCATDGRKVGLALGCMEDSLAKVVTARTGGYTGQVAGLVASWIPESGPTLLALDAPLGWPSRLGEVLGDHSAGMPISAAPNDLFRRVTDRVVKEEIGKQPLDVGADRIARTAHAALKLLQEVRDIIGRPIPLAWSPEIEDVSVIEVYPAATLTACGIQASGYKRTNQSESRAQIVDSLSRHMELPRDISRVVSNADVLDAAVCVLAGADFLRGQAIEPTHRESAEKEGWIWVRRTRHTPPSGLARRGREYETHGASWEVTALPRPATAESGSTRRGLTYALFRVY